MRAFSLSMACSTFLTGAYSYLMQEIASKLAVNASYEKACEVLADIFRSICRSDLWNELSERPVRMRLAIMRRRPLRIRPAEAVVTVATLDKKGVVMRKPPSDDTGVRTDPKKPGKKKMSTVISAYNIERHIRSADDVAGEINEEKPLPSKPKPRCKQVWGSLTEGPEKTRGFSGGTG